jgi:site-specific DNA recombinase
VSLASQLQRCEAYAELYGLEVVAQVVDAGVSAKTLKRDGWRDVERRLDAGEASGVIVAKLDRLTRSLRDLDRLLQRYFLRDVSLHCVAERVDTSSAAGRLCLNMLVSVAQWERETIAERTSAALQHRKANGQRYCGVGRPRFGYHIAPDGVSLVEDPAEQEVIDRIRDYRAAGASIREIAQVLNEAATPARGKRWHPTTVSRVLKREAA